MWDGCKKIDYCEVMKANSQYLMESMIMMAR